MILWKSGAVSAGSAGRRTCRAQRLCHNPSFAPSGLARGPLFTHGLRPGLYSCAATRLFCGLATPLFARVQGCDTAPFRSSGATRPKGRRGRRRKRGPEGPLFHGAGNVRKRGPGGRASTEQEMSENVALEAALPRNKKYPSSLGEERVSAVSDPIRPGSSPLLPSPSGRDAPPSLRSRGACCWEWHGSDIPGCTDCGHRPGRERRYPQWPRGKTR